MLFLPECLTIETSVALQLIWSLIWKRGKELALPLLFLKDDHVDLLDTLLELLFDNALDAVNQSDVFSVVLVFIFQTLFLETFLHFLKSFDDFVQLCLHLVLHQVKYLLFIQFILRLAQLLLVLAPFLILFLPQLFRVFVCQIKVVPQQQAAFFAF